MPTTNHSPTPPMPKPPDKVSGQTESPGAPLEQKISFSPPVWLFEIQTNKLFNKVKTNKSYVKKNCLNLNVYVQVLSKYYSSDNYYVPLTFQL